MKLRKGQPKLVCVKHGDTHTVSYPGVVEAEAGLKQEFYEFRASLEDLKILSQTNKHTNSTEVLDLLQGSTRRNDLEELEKRMLKSGRGSRKEEENDLDQKASQTFPKTPSVSIHLDHSVSSLTAPLLKSL